MRVLLILGFVALTSVSAYLYGKRVLRLPRHKLSVAWSTVLECVWLSFVFFISNLLVAFMGILTLRAAVGSFISLYNANDVMLLVLSLFQGIMFHLWRRETARLER